VSRSTSGPLGAPKFWDVQHTTSESHGCVEVPRLPVASLAALRPPQAWLLLRGLPVGLVDTCDLALVEPFRTWSDLGPLLDIVPGAAVCPAPCRA
jgi:hypothetical protein